MPGSSKPKGGKNGGGGGEQHTFVPSDIVLGKIKGYPPWPGVLVHHDSVPKAVLSALPGKTYHIVRFFPAADYGFNRAHELKLLTEREIRAFLSDPYKRAADLKEAYKIALDPKGWIEEQDELVKKGEEPSENEDMLAEEEEEEEEEEEDDEQPAPKKPAQQKRKLNSTSTAKSKPKNEPVKKKAKTQSQSRPTSVVATSSAAKSASRKDSSADAEGGADADEAELDPDTKRVKGWRHALQRAFLTRDGVIASEGIEQHDKTFRQVEEDRDITVAQLRVTKIGKVMKRIAQLPDVPRDDDFHFRQRAQKLCDVWSEVLAGGGSVGPAAESKAKPVAATGTNGSRKEEDMMADVKETTNGSAEERSASVVAPKEATSVKDTAVTDSHTGDNGTDAAAAAAIQTSTEGTAVESQPSVGAPATQESEAKLENEAPVLEAKAAEPAVQVSPLDAPAAADESVLTQL